MNESLHRAKERYLSQEIPEELPFSVASAIRTGDRRRARHKMVRRGLATALSACACFALLLNVSPNFATAVAEVPVLGELARIFTVTQYTVDDRDHLIDVRLPALENTGHTDLEQRINTEIKTRIDQVLAEAEVRAQEAREAYIQTGGIEEEFIPIIIDADYEIKCQNEQYLSFVITKTETLASAYSELYVYNIDLQTGKELTLPDLLGSDYKTRANAAVLEGIAQRSLDPDASFFDGSEGIEGFQSIHDQQKFYINTAGNPVILFEKYEIAPGYMGELEFEVPK